MTLRYGFVATVIHGHDETHPFKKKFKKNNLSRELTYVYIGTKAVRDCDSPVEFSGGNAILFSYALFLFFFFSNVND